jgi:hypothetical protein
MVEECGRESELVEDVTAARPMRKAFPLFVCWPTKISWCLLCCLTRFFFCCWRKIQVKIYRFIISFDTKTLLLS